MMTQLKPTAMYTLIVPPVYYKTGRQKECGMIVMRGPVTALRRHAKNVNKYEDVNFQIRRWDGSIVGKPTKTIPIP